MKKFIVILIISICCLSINTNAQRPKGPPEYIHSMDLTQVNEITPDLFPETSRYIHELNMELMYALKPALDEYKEQKISVIHKGFSNFLNNLEEPLNAINSLLQLNFTQTAETIARFTINSTVGMLGIMDPAEEMGLPRNNQDFGETMGIWGVPMGGFFVMPFYAQTTTRDFAGKIIDGFLNPVNYLTGWTIALFIDMSSIIMSIYDNYDFIITTNETSIDSYETFKTMYLQYRKNVVKQNQLFSTDSPSKPEETNILGESYNYDFDMEF